ncbi:hypothetical protein F2Q69_00044582 [Brassica cretica]|uniref:Uncharacterized protein n=1 Tax=Brassica cretica TaxID=69181 RepID=A0A8S9NHB6_BRACR|nr:hypothetical protein F2Q69_00044582 [Brassica cretica]
MPCSIAEVGQCGHERHEVHQGKDSIMWLEVVAWRSIDGYRFFPRRFREVVSRRNTPFSWCSNGTERPVFSKKVFLGCVPCLVSVVLETINEEADHPEGSIDVVAWKGQRSRWGVGADSRAEQSHVFLDDITSLLPWVECMDEHPMEVTYRRVPAM